MKPLYAAILALPILLRLLRSNPSQSRESVLNPRDERVILLGASSGVGKDLALAYATRGARICLVARRESALEAVKAECVARGLDAGRVIVLTADVTSGDDLIRVRDAVVAAWGGFDTLHILAGVPSTRTLLQIAGVDLTPDPLDPTRRPRLIFTDASIDDADVDKAASTPVLPSKEGLAAVAAEARACSEINYIGTVLALACFLPLLASTSRAPVVHHLSSVAATIPAPMRAIYASTKAAALAAVESCRVECEGSGVRFFSLLPGTIDNEFRTKTALAPTGGNCEVKKGVKFAWDKLLLPPSAVVETILVNLSITADPTPIVPYPPFSWLRTLYTPPKSTLYLPWQYKMATLLNLTPLGWLYVEPNARKKYGLRP